MGLEILPGRNPMKAKMKNRATAMDIMARQPFSAVERSPSFFIPHALTSLALESPFLDLEVRLYSNFRKSSSINLKRRPWDPRNRRFWGASS